MSRLTLLIAAMASVFLLNACSETVPEPADTVFRNGLVYTMEPDNPTASAIAVRGNEIVAVLQESRDADPFIGGETRVIDLRGRFLMPGFIDSHTHFNQAGALINGANLLRISDAEGLRAEIRRVVRLLEEGEWITGGLWGAYESWRQGSSGEEAGANTTRWHPNRQMIDNLTLNHPVFLNSFDRDPASRLYLANQSALVAAGLFTSPVDGMELDNTGSPTGLIFPGSPAIEMLTNAVKPKSEKRLLDENRAALAVLASAGVVEIHDITRDDQMERFGALEEAGDLTARVWMRADLSRAAEFNERGITMGSHPTTGTRDRYLRWGAYKGYIDGIMGNHSALFFEPYDDQPDNVGHYRAHTSDDADYAAPNMEKIYGYLTEAAKGGFVANVHAIGTKGSALMLDTYERLANDLGRDLSGYRVIHAQVIRPDDFPRFQALNVIAEVNPYHLSDDMRWMEERIGYERSKGAYAFKSLLDNGATLVFGSDWPGTNAAEYFTHPKYLLHAAVNRTTLEGMPEGGWFPDQKIVMEEALKAYTINAARATFDEDVKGTLKVGKLADLVILDQNPLEIAPKDILTLKVDLTMVDGKVVFQR